MAKRGETRPWRIRFEWLESGGTVRIKATETRSKLEYAWDLMDTLRMSSRRGSGGRVRVTIQHRDHPEPTIIKTFTNGTEEVEADV